MGLVKFGQGVSKISGKVGGSVFAHNRGGSYVRNFSVPTNPSTVSQQEARLALTSAVEDWQVALTDAQRDAWKTFAGNVPQFNRLGDEITLTGQQAYVASASLRTRVGLPVVDDAPVVFSEAPFATDFDIAVSDGSNDIDVSFDNGDAWANEDGASLLIFAGREQAQSVNFFKGPFRFAGKVDGDGATPPTSPTTLTGPFGYNSGTKVFMRAVVVRADGRQSVPVIFPYTVT